VSDLDRKLVRGSAWLALSFGGGQIVTFGVTALLAHLLLPADFGLVAIAGIFIVALATLQDSGLSFAVIQRRTDLERSAATAHAFFLISAIVMSIGTIVAAPLVAHLFSEPRLTEVLRVLTLVLIARGASGAAATLIERELNYGGRARGELAGTLVQAAVAVPMAATGYGVWSLVAGQIAGQVVQSVIFIGIAPFRPSLRLADWKMLRELSRFGRHVTTGNVITLIDANVDTVIVARLLGAADVAFYNVAYRLCNLPATGIGYILGRVMFPAYATIQEDKEAFKEAFLSNVRRIALVSLPVGVGMFIAARPLVVGVFGERWEPSVTPLRILAFYGLTRAFAGTTGPVFQAAGRPHIISIISGLYTVVFIASLLALVPPFGIVGAATALTATAAVPLLLSFWSVLKILELPLRELLHNLRRPALCTVPLAVTMLALLLATPSLREIVQLLLLLVAGIAVYAASLATVGRHEVRTIAAAFRS
jgi:PST family polysaccharide transporter/lipopolysaccharide exporter